jgi:hypothetical protein
MNDTVDRNMLLRKVTKETDGAHVPYSPFRAGVVALVG